ncbi:MAG: ParB family transcriptional regulator, chromosome partitioning protein [Candidatus Binatota bacterium]|jgi:ParB family chromosome partitioning protein|nr:ParB family transcriptional regulator, chromosome partitioning protein [Candidatus Binatota bacterium]
MDGGAPLRLAAGSIAAGRRTLITLVPLERIRPNPDQPRRHFDESSLAELAQSIQERGLLQPVIVKSEGQGRFLLLAGERRYRASKIAGLSSIPALVRDDDPLEIAMIENLQREDLTPLEEAFGMAQLIEQHGYTHSDIAGLIHKSRPYVSNTLALTRLPPSIQDEYNREPSVPREILLSVARQKDEDAMLATWRRVKLEKLSVRQLRSELDPSAAIEPRVRKTVTAARRLGRRLSELPGELPAELRGRLERTLGRVGRRIDRFLAAGEPDAD